METKADPSKRKIPPDSLLDLLENRRRLERHRSCSRQAFFKGQRDASNGRDALTIIAELSCKCATCLEAYSDGYEFGVAVPGAKIVKLIYEDD